MLILALMMVTTSMVVRAKLQADFPASLVAWQLQFPAGLKPEAVTAFLTGLSGLARSWWQTWLPGRAVIWEVAADQTGISHRLLVPEASAAVVRGALRAHLPGVRIAELEAVPPGAVTLAGQLGLSSVFHPLRTDAPEAIAAGLLASLQPLPAGQSVTIQLVLRPVGPVTTVAASPSGSWSSVRPNRLAWSTPASPEQVKAQRLKHRSALFLVTPRLGVQAASAAQAKSLLGRVMAPFHAANAPGAHLYRLALPSWLVGRSLIGRSLPVVVPPCLLNAAELTGLIGIPLGDKPVAGMRLGATRQLPPSADIPRRGRVVAEATFPGAQRELALSVLDSLRHLHLIGPTGTGKSTAMLSLITQDMVAGRGVVVIDPKGDLAADVLDRVPPHRVSDVVVLDPADEGWPVGLNLLACRPEDAELVVDQVVGTLHSLFRASWGPRTDDILRSALLTLVGQPGMTLCEVPLLLTDPTFRRRLVGRIDDPVALGPFWAWFESLSDAERAAAIGPVLNKLRAFLLRRSLRNVLGQATPRLDLGHLLGSGGILVVPLAKGLLGEEAAALLGSLIVAQLWQATMARAGLPPDQRPPVMAYIDEVQDYLHLPTNIADLLAQARGLGLGLNLAHQHLGQLPTNLRDGVLANARSRLIFQAAAGDAARLAKELSPYVTAADLQHLGPYEVVASLSAGNRVAPPVTGRTLPPPEPTGQAATVRERSRAQFGQARDVVEAAIRARRTGPSPDGPVGRRAARS